MSRDFYNPLLLLIVVILLSCRISHVGDAGSLEVWVMAICATGFVLDGALALARALTQRPSVMCVVWAMVFLLVGCSTWIMATTNQGVETDDLEAYRTMYQQYRDGADVNARNENGDTLLMLAVECGKENVVRTLLSNSYLTAEQLPQAAMRAVIVNRVHELQLLLEAGVPAVLSEEVEDRAVFLLVLLEMLGGAVVTERQELLGNVVYSGCDFFACHSLVVLSFVVTLFICFYKDIKFF
jgi:hypothetical protein